MGRLSHGTRLGRLQMRLVVAPGSCDRESASLVLVRVRVIIVLGRWNLSNWRVRKTMREIVVRLDQIRRHLRLLGSCVVITYENARAIRSRSRSRIRRLARLMHMIAMTTSVILKPEGHSPQDRPLSLDAHRVSHRTRPRDARRAYASSARRCARTSSPRDTSDTGPWSCGCCG